MGNLNGWGSIGHPTDDEARTNTTLFGRTYVIEKHQHALALVYPTLAPAITVTDGGAAWTLGNFATIIGAGVITTPYDIHEIDIASISANDNYELHLFWGASDTLACMTRFTKAPAMEGTLRIQTRTLLIPGSSQIRAKVASAIGGRNITISIGYHEY